MKYRRLLMVVIIITMMISTSIVANAVALGGRWNTNPSYNADGSRFESQVDSGANSWNSALSSIGSSRRINHTSKSSTNVSIVIYGYGNVGWNAQGEPGPNLTSGSYTYATMRLNTTYMNTYSNAKNKAICTHEWGHILGLAHYSSSSPRSLMYAQGSSIYYDQWGISSPTSFDVSELNKIY